MQQRQRPSSTPQEELDLPDDIDHSSDNTFSPLLINRNNAGKWPKSALRQPYTSSKLPVSSRRVRFDLGNSEVLPTTSPETSKPLFPQVASTRTDYEEYAFHSAFDDNGEHQKPVSRKKSSSEALRALSRAPLEEGTVWTVVESNIEPFLGQEDAQSTKESLANALFPEIQGFGAPVSSVNENHENERGSDYEDSSDDEFLAMAKTRKYSTTPVPVSDGTTRSSSYPMPLSEAELEEEDQIFSFELNGGFTTPPSSPPVITATKESTEEKGVPLPTSEFTNVEPIAAPIGKLVSPQDHLTRSTTRLSVGLYKGRTLSWQVIQRPEVHELGAALGKLDTFVGGLNGRSGIDEGDSYSFCASLLQPGYPGTPRSLTERLLMEEATQHRQENFTSL